MCGISACVAADRTIDKSRFEAMTDIVSYRGPDDRGFYYDGDIALGHRRLSIIDLSKNGHQPFEMVDGFVIVFNGEIYNYIELREELTNKGHCFATGSDTEAIVHSYKEWGKECVNHFNGMWAFVLYDKEKQILFCSRDRFGVKPFYYTEQEGLFLVASEIKQFFEVLNDKPRADVDRLIKYILRGDTDTPPFTLYKDIYQLEPGFNLVYDLKNHSYVKYEYYSLNTKEDSLVSYENACENFRNVFTESVKVRLRSDVQVGYFLSGGLDSSSIVCIADKIRHELSESENGCEQHTISSCYNDKQYDEQEYIDAVVNVTDVTVHKVFPDTEDMWERIDKVLWHMDEPLFSASGLSQWSVCEAASDHGLVVVLDGQGSDEQLAGYNDFYAVLFIDLLRKGKFRKLKQEIDSYIRLNYDGGNRLSWRSLLLSAIKDCITPQYLDRFFKRFYYINVAHLPFEKRMIRNAFKDINVYPRRNARGFIKAYMTDELVNILHNLDRKTMAFSLEARDPFLDYRLVDEVYGMPFSYKIRNGWTKAVLRDGMEGILPVKVQKRKTKLAFVAPIEKWINEDRTTYRSELKSSLQKLTGLFDGKIILDWYDDKKSLSTSDCNLIWRIIISGRWLDMFEVEI